jgi:hypothetical protein
MAELGADQVFDKSNDIDSLILYCNNMAAAEPGTMANGVLV